MKSKIGRFATMVFGLAATANLALADSSYVVTFDDGNPEGFSGTATVDLENGNPYGNAHCTGSTMWLQLRTSNTGSYNPEFLGDYSQYSSVTLSFDIKINSIDSCNGCNFPLTRNFLIGLIDTDHPGNSGPAAVYYSVGELSQTNTGTWTTKQVTITNTSSTTLPPGWIGAGEQLLVSPYTISLPPGQTFASVLADVDRFEITTLEPGYFYGDNYWDVRIDNIRISKTMPSTENCCRGTTCVEVAAGACTGAVAGSNSLVVASCGAGDTTASCCYADYNHDGIQSIDDLFLYFNAYFTSSPYANMAGDAIATPTIDDLFLYINAYFGSCL